VSGLLITFDSINLCCAVVQVVDRVLLEVELLLPLVRVSLTCMSVDSLQLLQAEAIGELLLANHYVTDYRNDYRK
jgi:hypothetical protein